MCICLLVYLSSYKIPNNFSVSGTITPPIVAEREEGPSFYKNLSVLVPIVCAIVVLLVITLVILIVCLKKNRNPDYAVPPQNQGNLFCVFLISCQNLF